MNEPAPEGSASPTETAGELLKAARQRQGLHISVMAASLKVSPRKLELIEANRFDELPDTTFARSLALSMCRALKIDSAPILRLLPQSVASAFDSSISLNQPFRDRPGDGVGESTEWSRYLTAPVLLAVVLVLGAIALYAWPSTWWRTGLEQASAVFQSPVATPTVAGTAPVAVSASPAVAATPEPSAASEPSGAVSSVVETVFSAPDEGAPGPVSAKLLGLRASGESWIEVRDASGEVLLSRTLLAGESTGVDGSPPLRVTVGNAAVTQITFRGQPVELADSTRDNVARLELK